MGKQSQPLYGRSADRCQRNPCHRRPLCLFLSARLERNRSGSSHLLVTFRKKLRRRRLRRPPTDDRLGSAYASESRADIAYQRYHHDAHMDGLLSLQQHIHLCVPPHVCRPETNGHVEG